MCRACHPFPCPRGRGVSYSQNVPSIETPRGSAKFVPKVRVSNDLSLVGGRGDGGSRGRGRRSGTSFLPIGGQDTRQTKRFSSAACNPCTQVGMHPSRQPWPMGYRAGERSRSSDPTSDSDVPTHTPTPAASTRLSLPLSRGGMTRGPDRTLPRPKPRLSRPGWSRGGPRSEWPDQRPVVGPGRLRRGQNARRSPPMSTDQIPLPGETGRRSGRSGGTYAPPREWGPQGTPGVADRHDRPGVGAGSSSTYRNSWDASAPDQVLRSVRGRDGPPGGAPGQAHPPDCTSSHRRISLDKSTPAGKSWPPSDPSIPRLVRRRPRRSREMVARQRTRRPRRPEACGVAWVEVARRRGF